MRGVLAAWLAWVLLAGVAAAQTSPIYAWSVTSAGKPYGCASWGDGQEGVWFTLSRQATSLPISGHDYLRIAFIPNNDLGDDGMGCAFAGESSSVAQGAVRYIRFRVRYNSPINWRSDNSGGAYSANNRTAPDKLFIMGNTCGTPTRMIAHQYAEGPDRDTPILRFTQGTGGAAPADWLPIPVDQWNNVQLKVLSSSDGSTSDGATYIYLNNDAEGSPDASEVGQLITTTGWSTAGCPSSGIIFGDGSMNPLSDDDVTTAAVNDYADFEYDDEFDPHWHSGGGGGGGGSGPVRLRLSGSDVVLLAGLCLCPWVLGSRPRHRDRQ